MTDKPTSLNRYSHWDGSQKSDLNADDILSAISEDLMEFGDLQQAMRYLMQRGMTSSDGNYIKGLRDLLRQLKEQRRQRLDRFDMGSVMDDIKRQLDEILEMEKASIDEWIDPWGVRVVRKRRTPSTNQGSLTTIDAGNSADMACMIRRRAPGDILSRTRPSVR